MITISAAQVFFDHELGPATLAIRDGRVDEVRPDWTGAADVVLDEGFLVPGFVDLQVNGWCGVDFIDADPDAWSRVAGQLPHTGVTAFAPTFITAPLDVLVQGLTQAEQAMEMARHGARILGVHLEGPFLAPTRRGAHRVPFSAPETGAVAALLDAARPGTLALMTIAPELPRALDAVRQLVEGGVRVSIGHSDATSEEAAAAADAGASLVTHLFNAQRPLHHRDPGVVGQALTDERLTCGLILDLEHVSPVAARIAFAAARGRVALVTDAAVSMGLGPGRYRQGDASLIVEGDGPPRRDDGTIAGANLSLDKAIANAVSIGIDPETAFDAATRVPADAMGRRDLGRIGAGARADLVWLDDDFNVRATWIGGELVHGTAGSP